MLLTVDCEVALIRGGTVPLFFLLLLIIISVDKIILYITQIVFLLKLSSRPSAIWVPLFTHYPLPHNHLHVRALISPHFLLFLFVLSLKKNVDSTL